jgi:hypothetical protein
LRLTEDISAWEDSLKSPEFDLLTYLPKKNHMHETTDPTQNNPQHLCKLAGIDNGKGYRESFAMWLGLP